jgi:primosomal protein N' (replication factor Y) (superfamily II helicase)
MIVHVALPLPIHRVFSYSLPNDIAPYVEPLSRVRIPFNNRSLVGFVLEKSSVASEENLKAVEDLVDPLPLIDSRCFQLCQWSSNFYVSPLGLVLKYALPSFIKAERYLRVGTADSSMSHLDGASLSKAYGAIGKVGLLDSLSRSVLSLNDVFTGLPLTPEGGISSPAELQPMAYSADIDQRIDFYLSLVARTLSSGKNVLVLLPDRHGVGDVHHRALVSAFPGLVYWYVSSMTEKKKAESYFRARNEVGRLFLGNKSTVFLPIRDLGLIIVERPEEEEYRNEKGFKFNAVRLALRKAEIEKASLVLGSVSPSIEVMRGVMDGEIRHSRVTSGSKPSVYSLRNERAKSGTVALAPPFLATVREAMERGGNVVVHSHRKSYAAGLRCSACGRPAVCTRCGSLSITYNRETDKITCNGCKASFPYIERCPTCSSPFIRFFDIGAEFLESALREEFPERMVIRATGDADRRSKRSDLGDWSCIKGAIVVGTHVLSKLYGLKADRLILYRWDQFLRTAGYRAREKMFHLLGNMVDAVHPEEIFVHSEGDDDFDISILFEPDNFFKDELERRKMTEFPPYSRLFIVNVLRGNSKAADKALKTIVSLLDGQYLDEQVLGPIEIKGQYEWRIVLKGDEQVLAPVLMSLYRLPGVHIEADPLYV